MPLNTPLDPAFVDVTDLAAGLAGAGFRTNLNTNIDSAEAQAQAAQANLELMANALGFGALSGGAISVGTGLTANIAAGAAIIGSHVSWNAIVSPALAQSTTNYIWMRQDGTASATTTTTAPSGDGKGYALLWGTATTNTTNVTAVTNIRHYFMTAFGSMDTIPAGQTVYLPEGYQQIIKGPLNVNGVLHVNGTLFVEDI